MGLQQGATRLSYFTVTLLAVTARIVHESWWDAGLQELNRGYTDRSSRVSFRGNKRLEKNILRAKGTRNLPERFDGQDMPRIANRHGKNRYGQTYEGLMCELLWWQ